MNPTTLAALAAFPSQLEARYAAIPHAFRHWAPPSWEGVPSEAFTAIEHLCHVRDIEVEGYHVRFRRTLEESHPTLASIDSEPLAIARAYGMADAEKVLAEFRIARARTMDIVSNLTDVQLARTAVFEGYGPLTMRSLVHYLCSHDQQHLAGLQWLAGKIDASKAAVAA
ncbi:DinB family protein [Variovorax paradoxus]|uniref:DinB family protein n=1 Tax=Variovorax paradoxus TaxID=34073 RepID=UPI003ED01D0F